MDKKEWKELIIKHLYNNPNGGDLKLDLKVIKDVEFDKAIIELKRDSLIKTHHQFGYWDVLTNKGYAYHERLLKERLKSSMSNNIIERHDKNIISFIKKVTLSEWLAIISILTFIIYIWTVFIKKGSS